MNKGSHTKKNVISLFSRKFSIRMFTQKWKSKCAVGQCYPFLTTFCTLCVVSSALGGENTGWARISLAFRSLEQFSLLWEQMYEYIQLHKDLYATFWTKGSCYLFLVRKTTAHSRPLSRIIFINKNSTKVNSFPYILRNI